MCRWMIYQWSCKPDLHSGRYTIWCGRPLQGPRDCGTLKHEEDEKIRFDCCCSEQCCQKPINIERDAYAQASGTLDAMVNPDKSSLIYKINKQSVINRRSQYKLELINHAQRCSPVFAQGYDIESIRRMLPQGVRLYDTLGNAIAGSSSAAAAGGPQPLQQPSASSQLPYGANLFNYPTAPNQPQNPLPNPAALRGRGGIAGASPHGRGYGAPPGPPSSLQGYGHTGWGPGEWNPPKGGEGTGRRDG